MAGSCECGNEYSGSINAGISWLAEYLLASQEGLCCMELTHWHQVRYFLVLRRDVVVMCEAVLNVPAMQLFNVQAMPKVTCGVIVLMCQLIPKVTEV